MKTTIDQPIINSPFGESKQYWSYNREHRLFFLKDGRLSAGYILASQQSRAVALGILKKKEIPEDLLDILDLKIELFADPD